MNDDGTIDASERTEAAIARKLEWIREAAGERFNAIELNLLLSRVVITGDRRRAAEKFVRESRRAGTTAEQVLANPYLLIGSVEQVIEQLQRLRERYGISYFVVGDESMEALAPVVARLGGR